MSETTLASGFGDLRVAAHFCRILENQGITIPTPIQAEAIPVALEGKDLIGIAQTGTGKTLAFGLPMVENLKSGEVGLVLAPTRELAQQIAETYSKLNVQCALVVGGASMLRQKHELRNNPKVIVATPGRLQDHMYQRTVRLNNVSIVVLDEADRMFDMGFAPAIMRILDELPENRQTMLFSATFPKDVEQLAARYQVDPVRIEVDKAFSIPELIDQELVFLTHEEKKTKLTELLYDNNGTVLVFARTRHGARKLAKAVRDDGHTAAELHADRTLAQRREALAGFKQGHFRVLVATDIAARGIDVKDISLVINFDVPECADDYIHRIGRTGRAGAEGRAIMLAMPQQARDVKDIEKLMGMQLRICDTSTSIPASFKPDYNPDSFRPKNRSERPNRAPRVERKERTRERDRLASVTENPEATTEERAPRAPQPERPWNHDRPSSENRPWNNDRPQGDRPFNRDSRPQGDRPYNRDSRPQGGGYQGNRPFNRDSRPQGDRPFGRDSRPQGGDRPWNNDRPQGQG
ncbi:MAG: DEAD/DEAH box helicase, partial [Fimbriimonadaceae bacterium]